MINRATISTAWGFKSLSIILLIFSTGLEALEYKDYEKKIKNGYQLRSAIEKMPRSDLERNLREFVATGRPNRLLGSPGHKKAQDFLEIKLKSYANQNSSFYKHLFVTNDNKDGINFVWEKKGVVSPNDVLILSANYDTLLRDAKNKKILLTGEMPGADNNGSGVAILLSLIEILDKLEIPKTVRVVFLDAEEFGGAGSLHFAKKTKEEMGSQKISGVINLSMLGHDSRMGDKDQKMNNMNIYLRPRDQVESPVTNAFGQMILEHGKRHYNTVVFTPKETFSGDYFPNTSEHFWAQGIPAVTMTQNREGDLNPRFMTSNDFVETLNINTYSNVFKYIASAVLAWDYDVVK